MESQSATTSFTPTVSSNVANVPAAGISSRPATNTAPIDNTGKFVRQIQSSQLASAHTTSPLPSSILQSTKFPLVSGPVTAGFGSEILVELLKMAQENPQPQIDAKVGEYYRRSTPSSFPLGIDLQSLIHEREKILEQTAEIRIAYLEKRISEEEDLILRNKLHIELKTLKLRSMQRSLREQVMRLSNELKSIDNFNDRGSIRRGKRQSMRDARMGDGIEGRVQRRERPKERDASDFVKSILLHHRELQNQWRNAAQRRAKLVKQVMQHHSNYEKEEHRKSERMMRERMRLLKNNDEAAYFQLLDQEKDVRLTYLLKQTDEFLINLAEKVSAHQDVTSQRLANDTVQSTSLVVDDKDASSNDQALNDFYKRIHRAEVNISEQPKMLLGGTLKEYQMKGLQWMVSLHENRLNGILADEMGLGKTIQSIALISYLIESLKLTGPFLIIVPLSTMTNWSLEFEKWAPHVKRIEYKGLPAQRKQLQSIVKHGQFNVLLTTYEYIIKDKAALSKTKWLYLIVDEGHRMKNSHSKLVTVLTQFYSTRYRLILTGTPLQNNLPELWALLNFLLPDVFNSCKTFEDWFNAPFANTGEKMELNEEEMLLVIRRLHKVLHPFLLRRMKRDVEGELPEKVEVVLKCPMSALQSNLYRAITSSSTTAMQDSRNLGIRRLNNTIMQLRKICNHPFVFEEVERQMNPYHVNNELLYRVSGKFELLYRILPKFASTGHKILMFFQMTQIMTIMEDFLNMLGYKYLRLDGSTKADERTDLLTKFNEPNSPYFIFLLSTRAGGLGLNLQTADTVVIFDSDWNPHQDLQAQDRAHRIGQTREVRIFRLITVESVEEYILKRAQQKLSLDGKIIQAGKFDQRSTNEERDEMLRAILEREAENREDEEIYDDEELNEIIARNDLELVKFKQIDEEYAAKDKVRYERTSIKLPRLMENSELPKVYLNSIVEEVQEEDFDDGIRSARKKDVTYDETMSDRKWLKQFETTQSADESTSSRKRYQDEDSDVDSLHSSPLKMPKLRLKVPVRPPSRDSGISYETKLDIMRIIYSAIENCVEPDTNRYRSDLFLELPDPSLYGDYYKLIKHPISLAEINEKMDDYDNVEQFLEDIDLMCDNAMQYNVEGSEVYEDAQFLKQLAHDKGEELLAAQGRLASDSGSDSD